MPENIKKEKEFVELLLGINKENIEFIFRQIDENSANKAIEIVEFSILIRPLETENLLTLISLISSKFGVVNLPNPSRRFTSS
jgi:hypothetical protein